MLYFSWVLVYNLYVNNIKETIMANWKEIRTQAGKTANKAIKKTGEIADSASKYVKLKIYDAKLSSKYEELGRLTYKQIKTETSMAERISEVIGEIDTLRAQRKALHDEIEADKKRRAEEKTKQNETAFSQDEAQEETQAE